ncbi:ABC transporter ATP-binding protein [Solemya velum gill symbiont]|uniref:ABC-type dipeptide transporter n=1 Tax=Solemya velum gill symbiont TaxID=2340 RepID=A0A1T2DZ54_SOVGS|nr:ABC transporter ATP-binding protein [Solemya velum gill symbiont]OOY34001.1 ABC transporter ATP-binding protein [Solemya velum gill symbiont]OOY36676.1 ABC transporter ATP-binding protein [Solemya velum gill symbiont]OOY39505.1 ABC transporter ATP-binding protein [Solemya velum gill symbiont]OOY43295.1 ABC transporter ATP-binding protein [Solemya velum gill symbiont]OOY45435.1 ABC transporter ATP-binding protein [Solemya velum gill symbiont]
MTDSLLSIHKLTTQIGRDDGAIIPVSSVSFDIHPGETFALLGESGCGKSMTALSVMRLLPPAGKITEGEIFLDGINLRDLPEVDMRAQRGGNIGMIFQEPMTSLNPVLTVAYQVGETVKLHDEEHAGDIDARVLELLQQVGIPDPERRMSEYPHQLSGGMKQRVMIAMALAGRPKLLIADEPTTALDVTIQAQVLDLLRDLQKRTGMAILLITHDLGVVAETADRVGVMYAGEIIETAPVDTFFAEPQHPYSQRLFDALPSVERRNRPLTAIEGNVPSLAETFRGCRFRSRCDVAKEICATELPPWHGDQEHGYLCHLQQLRSESIEAPQEASISEQEPGKNVLRVEQMQLYFPIKKGLLRRTVGHVRAVDGIDLDISSGKTVALVGESGCGKTTVGKGILQLLRPTSGSVQLNGTELTKLKGENLRSLRAGMQMIFQDPASSMNPRMTVEAIVSEGLIAQKIGKDRSERLERVKAILDRVGLPERFMKRYPHEFSGGQRQRIAIARSLVLRPDLLVCDEPTSALDVSVQAQILNLLKEIQDEAKIAYLFITHNISVVSYLADEVAVMYLGRIVEQGDVDTVLGDPKHPYTQALLSAVPVADPQREREIIRLPGDMPSPANPPSGCHFHPRCPRATDICSQSWPELSKSGTHKVWCHLHG